MPPSNSQSLYAVFASIFDEFIERVHECAL